MRLKSEQVIQKDCQLVRSQHHESIQMVTSFSCFIAIAPSQLFVEQA